MTKARTLADNFAADINAVSAGTGITGGGTSGTVTVTNSMATAIDAKGDLVVGTGADTFSRLAVASTAGYLLSVDSAEATGLKWAAPAGGGKVLQVVQDTLETNFTTTSTSYVDTGLSVTITPSSATSKVMIYSSGLATIAGSGSFSSIVAGFQLLRTSTTIQRLNVGYNDFASSTNPELFGSLSFSYLDSPATTSATTYKIQALTGNASTTARVAGSSTQIASIVVMEIGA